jgi:hypothetical protein
MAGVRQLRKDMNSELSSSVKVSISSHYSAFSRAFRGFHLSARVPLRNPPPLAAGIVPVPVFATLTLAFPFLVMPNAYS